MTPSEKTMCLDGFIRSFRWWGAFYLFATSVVGKADSKSLQQLLLNGCQIIRRYLGSQIIRRYLGSQIIQPILWEVNYFANIMGSTSQKPPGSVFPTLLILNLHSISQLFQIYKVTILWRWDLQTFSETFVRFFLNFLNQVFAFPHYFCWNLVILDGYWLKLAQNCHQPANQCFPSIPSNLKSIFQCLCNQFWNPKINKQYKCKILWCLLFSLKYLRKSWRQYFAAKVQKSSKIPTICVKVAFLLCLVRSFFLDLTEHILRDITVLFLYNKLLFLCFQPFFLQNILNFHIDLIFHIETYCHQQG